MKKWNLDKLYTGLDDAKLQEDKQKVEDLTNELIKLSQTLETKDPSDATYTFLSMYEKIQMLGSKIASYLSLYLSCDTTNREYNNALVVFQQASLRLTLPYTLFRKHISKIDNLDAVIKQHPYLEEHRFLLEEIKANSNHLLSDQEEVLAAELNQSGGSLWTRMHSVLTSTLDVDYQGKTIPLSAVRNLAHNSDQKIRKDAFIAEKKSYEKIAKSCAFALNGIKKEVITLSKKRNFSSPLEKTLLDSRIDERVLNALLQAMEESLPAFRAYLMRKAFLLNNESSLPFYDLFAPIGNTSSKKYSIEEAQTFILKNFASFSDDLHDMAKQAFNEDWVDYTPRKNKQGGAFCARIYPLKESRILTNFDGSIGDISTLAHELGHAYHNLNVYQESLLNANYPMPIAETASILCETIVKKAALDEATSNEEKISLLEQELQDSTQVIVDILSRFKFETQVFARVPQEFLNESTLNEIMIEAQKNTYGDGLDENYLHEGMWVNKGHYYSTQRSFYNFPYAFGLLFAKGIYAQYRQKGKAFVPELKKLLRISGKNNLIDVASTVGIDITNVDYWRSAIAVIKEDIDMFLLLSK